MTKDIFPEDVVAKAREQGMADDDIPDFTTPIRYPEYDRSLLEQFSWCPASARFIQTGRVQTANFLNTVGNVVHDAFSVTLAEYVRELEVDLASPITPSDLVDTAMGRLVRARPDVQPEAIAAAQPSLWPWAKYLFNIMPSNILKFDGGEGERDGQLGWDLPHLNACPTSELDLLHATDSTALLAEIDYKSGWKQWTEDDIKQSFQFQMHAVLVFENFTDVVEALDVRVWPTRSKEPTLPVRFHRKYLAEYSGRVVEALETAITYGNTEPEKCPTWAGKEKCRICDAARVCPVTPLNSCVIDPKQFVKDYIAVQAKAAAMREEAASYVDFSGADIVLDDGTAFGRRRPIDRRKPDAVIYQI